MRSLWLATGMVCALSMLAGDAPLSYPPTRKVEHVDEYHGVKVPDMYRWLEDPNSDDTREWVKKQNELTFGYLAQLPYRQKLLTRLTELYNYPKFSAPFTRKGRVFFFKNNGLQNQSVLYAQNGLHGDAQVLLDPNTLSTDGTVALAGQSLSDDGKLLAYGISRAGSDWVEFKVRDTASGKDLPDEIKWAKFTHPAWTRDGKGFFYSRYPEPDPKLAYANVNRFQKIYYHRLGTPQSDDVLVFERPDEPEWFIGGSVSDDGRYFVIAPSRSGPNNRVYYIDLKSPKKPLLNGPVVKLVDNFEASYEFIDNDGPVFYFQTNLNAPHGKVIAIDTRKPEPEHWKTIVPETQDALRDVVLAGNDFIASYLHNGYSQIQFYGLDGKFKKTLALPDLGMVGGFRGRRDDKQLFYTFTSFLLPPTIFSYDVKRGESTLFRGPQINVDVTPYETRQLWATSKDGTKVPLFVVCRKDVALDGNNPVLLTGYGGFNIPMTPHFAVTTVMWLEMGGVYALANMRGGGEFGEDWYKAGTKERKQNVFDDFIAAAEQLIKEKYTSSSRLAIAGGSNGGLLIGAAINQRPELFAAALPAVGVMDMLRFHKFTVGSAWVYDYGCSDDPEQFKYLHKISPLHNIKPGAKYPAVLVTTGDHDDRVVPAHSFKYAAALQAAQGGAAPVLIRIDVKAGHGAGKPTTKFLEEHADRWTFIVKNLGMTLK